MDWEKLLPDMLANSPWVVVLIWALRWFAAHVAKPLVVGHTSFLDATLKQMERTDRWLEAHAESLKTLSLHAETQTKLLEKMNEQNRRRTGK